MSLVADLVKRTSGEPILLASKETGLTSIPPPPRGKDAKSERIQAILAAALEEFFDQGFAAARLDAIAERAGIGKGTVYLYFDSKETLFEEAVRNMIAPLIDRLEHLTVAPQGSAEAMLRVIIATFYREFVGTERRRILRLLIGEGPRFPRLLAFYHREVVSRGIGVARKVIAHGVARGEFRETAVGDLPQVLIGPAMIGAIWMMLFNDFEPIDLEKLCSAHIDLVLEGLRLRA
jgi:AcrR family transcriptional regulator